MVTDLKKIMELSVQEKILLMEALWDSLENKEKYYTLNEDQQKNLEERIEEYKKNPSNVLTWQEIKSKIFNK
jgi:putative addiction module component (TIGR02574 family)